MASAKPRLLLLLAGSDHPHRLAAAATLSWLGAARGLLVECYFDAVASGAHFGGGHPAHVPVEDLRGGTVSGGHHLEELYRLVHLFDCSAAGLGPTRFQPVLDNLGVPFIAHEQDIVALYRAVFGALGEPLPAQVLVVGDGDRPQEVPLGAYAYPEIVNRRLLAIACGDEDALAKLENGASVEALWQPEGWKRARVSLIDTPADADAGAHTIWMANRWKDSAKGFILGDPELVGRWTPTAARESWLPLYGIPQSRTIARMRTQLAAQTVVFGRQQDDRDFLELSNAGVAFQLIDPGRPPFPVVKQSRERFPVFAPDSEPSDQDLRRWADEGRILATVLFWTGMIRELESLYALTDLLAVTRAAAGIVLTTGSYQYMREPPLALLYVPERFGGLAPRVEALLASAGVGAFLEAEAPAERFASLLKSSVDELAELLGGRDRVPHGWWGTLDTSWSRSRRPGRISGDSRPPYFRLRFTPRRIEETVATGGGEGARNLRSLVRRSPLGNLFEARRPFEEYVPGSPRRTVFDAVRDAGFEYAFTKSAFARRPAIANGVDGLTILNYTVGHWDGWTPFVTINRLSDLRQAERRLRRQGRPGWLVGTIDTCLWAFTGSLWSRGQELRSLCEWLAGGGDSRRLLNVNPRTVARYARVLDKEGRVDRLRLG
jgi:hypothetical protein